MPDLRAAKFAEEMKLQQKRVEPKVEVAGFGLQLASHGIPMAAASVIAAYVSKLEARLEALEKAAGPPHLRKQEKR